MHCFVTKLSEKSKYIILGILPFLISFTAINESKTGAMRTLALSAVLCILGAFGLMAQLIACNSFCVIYQLN